MNIFVPGSLRRSLRLRTPRLRLPRCLRIRRRRSAREHQDLRDPGGQETFSLLGIEPAPSLSLPILTTALQRAKREAVITTAATGAVAPAVVSAKVQGDVEKISVIQKRQAFFGGAYGSVMEVTLIVPPTNPELRQDEDTLDTWFSSGMWTFSTLGWRDKDKRP